MMRNMPDTCQELQLFDHCLARFKPFLPQLQVALLSYVTLRMHRNMCTSLHQQVLVHRDGMLGDESIDREYRQTHLHEALLQIQDMRLDVPLVGLCFVPLSRFVLLSRCRDSMLTCSQAAAHKRPAQSIQLPDLHLHAGEVQHYQLHTIQRCLHLET